MNSIHELEEEKIYKIETLKEKEVEAINVTEFSNVSTGNNNYLYYKLKESIKKAKSIDIIVSFLMESGVKMILDDLKEAIDRKVKIRILTGSYLNITQPSALYMLKRELKDNIDLRFYNVYNKSFHPKSYIFHNDYDGEIYIGSSNLSRGALTNSIEWNYRFFKSQNIDGFNEFYGEFENLFNNYSDIIDDEAMRNYSNNWKKPKVYKDLERSKENAEKDGQDNEQSIIIELFEPRGAQIEALYELENSRNEGFDKGLVVLATGVGKTYLAAFDSKDAKKILFVAHREEIIKQAAISFKNIRKSQDIGFFYNNKKDKDCSMVFALVQTLGKDEYLNENYFKRDYFDYIIIDEFHHAMSNNYKKIIDYFKPRFLLGLTATPERLDSKDVFALCDYNTVYELRLSDAINKGYLVPFRYYGIYDESVNYENVEFKNGKYDEKSLEDALMLNKRGELIFNHYKKYNSKRALGFCTSKKHAEYMAKCFCEKGIESVAVYSGENGEYSDDRSRALNNLIKGKIQVIFSVDIFNEEEYPEDCRVDFDFRIVDVFKKLAAKEMNVKERITDEFFRVKEMLGHRPSRVEFFNNIDDEVYLAIKKTKSALNPFNDYLGFLQENKELTKREELLINTKAHEFIKMIENTSMSKSYKMPVFLAFYNEGNVKMAIDEEDIYKNFYEFYHKGSNKPDMLRHKATASFEKWGKKEYIKLAKDNPVKFLLKSESYCFKRCDEKFMGLK